MLAYLIHWPHDWPPGSSYNKIHNLSNQPLFFPYDLPVRGHIRTCLNLSIPERKLKWNSLLQYRTQQRFMGPFLMAFVHSNECFTQLKVVDSKGINNVIKLWQQVRIDFSSHPITRRKI